MQNGTGLKFFSELYAYDFDNDILAAFSFTNQFASNINNYIYPDTWALNSATGILVGNNAFFNFSGTGFFNGNTLVKLNKPISLTRTSGNEIDYNSTLLFSYEKKRHGDEVLISSLSQDTNFPYAQSGFCVGINDANKLYFKYWNEVEGPFSFIYKKVIANKNLVAIQNDKKNSISIGVFNNNTQDFDFENFEIYREVFNDSKNICLGGIEGNKPDWIGNQTRNFSGYIDNFYFLRDIDLLQLDNLVSGIIYEPPNDIPGFLVEECFVEEIISGSGFLSFEETGITFGITTGYANEITGLETGISGILSTGITGYLKFLTGTSIDNCGDITELYAYESLTGTTVNNIEYEIELTGLVEITGWSEIRLSGFVERFTDVTFYNQICTDRLVLTGNINYNIQIGFLTSLSYDYVALLSQINPSNDKIEIFTENFQPDTLKYNVNLKYDQVKRNYYLLDKEYNENGFLLWANGQALINSGFDSIKDGYDEFRIPKIDYFVNGREIETVDIYKEFNNFLFYDNISGNYWAFKKTGNNFTVPNNLNNNYWLFKNGQKLIRDIDYTVNLTNIILSTDNQTGENYYIIKEIPDNFIYHSGNSGSLKLTGTFNHGCSQVYFNGIKQKINYNYFENSDFDLISGSFFNNASNNFIYNNTDDWFE